MVSLFMYMYASLFQSALMSGYTWLDKLSNLPPYFTTSHCILSIGTEVLVLRLRPRLQSVMSKLQENCIFTVHSQCVRLMEMAKGHLEVIREKIHVNYFIVLVVDTLVLL